jgi:hypothetical protein
MSFQFENAHFVRGNYHSGFSEHVCEIEFLVSSYVTPVRGSNQTFLQIGALTEEHILAGIVLDNING